MKRIYILFVLFGFTVKAQLSSGFGTPFASPTPPSVYSFTKYGDVPVNEYRGLADVSIPLYNIKADDVELPISLNYYTGGIKVAEEAGIVGLGWDMNMPSVIQYIKDEDDFKPGMRFCKLPDYAGSIYYPTRGRQHPNIPDSYSTYGMSSSTTEIDFLGEPSYFVSSGNFLIDNDHYISGTADYDNFVFSDDVDSEADIFNVSINGVQIVFMRSQESTNKNPDDLSSFISGNPLKVINGRVEYKVEFVNGPGTGIKVTDPGGNQYFFEKINTLETHYSNGGFLQYQYNNGTQTKPQTKIYDLTKIITNKEKQILLSYDTGNLSQKTVTSSSYYKRIGPVVFNYMDYPYDFYDMITVDNNIGLEAGYDNTNFFHDGLNYFENNPNQPDYAESTSTYIEEQHHNYLTSIVTPSETVEFTYSSREDYSNMRKLDVVEIFNTLGQSAKKYNLGYDYFISSSCTNCYSNDDLDIYKKRLKLTTVGLEGQNPHLFTYDETELPDKRSYSVDYWGYYNGTSNTSYNLSLPAMGYSSYYDQTLTDNAQNDFNASLYYAKACSLKRLTYPTGGYTEFEYQLNQFDDYLVHSDVYTPTITTGSGLRIHKIDNYTGEGELATTSTYSYIGGKNIFKKKLARTYNMSVLKQHNEVNSSTFHYFSSLILEVGLSNYLSSSVVGTEDYIGYDKVEITDKFKGKLTKTFLNEPYSIYNAPGTRNFNPMYFQDRYAKQNGSLLSELTTDENDGPKLLKEYGYKLLTSLDKRYGVNINKYDNFEYSSGVGYGTIQYFCMPNFLLSFYPIFSNSTIMNYEKITEHFPSGSKIAKTSIIYDANNLPISVACSDQYNDVFKQVTTAYKSDQLLTGKNLLNLPEHIVTSENTTVKMNQDFYYATVGNVTRLIESDILHLNNSTLPLKFYYDQFDDVHNLLQFHQKDGINTCIIWGYNKTLPIAKIENASYTTIDQNLISIAQDKSDTGTESELLDALDAIRQSLPDAMVTTYTHIPLTGLSTCIDQKNEMKVFHYDAFGRLLSVTDRNGNILSENEYNLRVQ